MATATKRKPKGEYDGQRIDFKNEPLDSSGAPINQYIPKFIAQAPWYVAQDGNADYLSHLRKQDTNEKIASMDTWYTHGEFKSAAKRFRPGACKNCGAMTHKEKDCMERPRKAGAWKTGQDIKPDEVIQEELNLTWDGKRDRWNGYDYENQKQVIEHFDEIAAERNRLKSMAKDEASTVSLDPDHKRFSSDTSNKMKVKPSPLVKEEEEEEEEESQAENSGTSNPIFPRVSGSAAGQKQEEDDSDSSSSSFMSDDEMQEGMEGEEKHEEEIKNSDEAMIAFQGYKVDKMRQSNWNLRIREDTPAYLRDVDSDRIQYNPKSRSVRILNNDPNDPAGQNFVLHQPKEFAATKKFAWDSHAKGANVSFYGDPTAVALMKKEHDEKGRKIKEIEQKTVLEKYGPQPQPKPDFL